ncbi:hypothetical protein ABTZ03_40080 [Kitasatospora sp. NPDC096077]|uniref:hypothetical protein n=1 Tax=Kitasatospora sp. NPDC096077 TaxID=3155544 RepID=UPI00332CC30F
MRSGSRWLIGITTAAAVVAPVAYVGYGLYSWDGSPAGIGCSTAVAFAGGSLPVQATEARCTDDDVPQEQAYTAEFRMPREDLAARLAAAFPRVRLGTDDASGLSFGNAHEANGPHPSGQATEIRLRASYDADGTALVRLRAFNG